MCLRNDEIYHEMLLFSMYLACLVKTPPCLLKNMKFDVHVNA